ncbi:MAG: AI-2E family transporter [Patescibacteria group bacterium]|nr:AI-2E family transporter [Patescibacteria group bacterium]
MPPSKTDNVSFNKMRSIFFFGLVGILTLAILYFFRPFVYPIFWATVIAIMFYPWHKKMLKIFKGKGLASLVTSLISFFVIFIPLVLLSVLLVSKSISLYNNVSQSSLFQHPEQVSSWLEKTPVAPYVETIKNEWTNYAAEAAKNVSGFIFNTITNVSKNSINFVLTLFVMFYTLYYLFKDGDRFLAWLKKISPLGDNYEDKLYARFTSTIRSTLKSTLIVGGVQGVLSGLLFWITGIQGAFVWGVIMVVIAIIPAIGTSIILVPAAIIMLVFGNVWQAIVLAVGALIISIIDNFLRPPLIGKDTQMHPLLVFFSTIGGLILFGVSGFVIGPVIAALYLSVMSIYEHYYKKDLDNN